MSSPTIVPFDYFRDPAIPEPAPGAEKQPATETPKSEEQPKAAPESPENKDTPGDVESEKKRAGVQKRIDDLTGRFYETKALLEDRDRQIVQLRQEMETFRRPPEVAAPTQEPKLDDYEDLPKYQTAHNAWLKAEVLREFEARENKRRAAELADRRVQTWSQRVTEAAKTTEDLFDVLRGVNVTPQMSEVIQDSEVGPQIAYFLGKNPAEAQRLGGLNVMGMAREIGKIEAKIQAQDKKTAEPPKQILSSAPPPPTPVESGQAKVELLYSDNMTMAEYMQWRDQNTPKQKRRR